MFARLQAKYQKRKELRDFKRDCRENAPEVLIDPEGEGIYILAEHDAPNAPDNALVAAAAYLGFENPRAEIRQLEVETLWMDPAPQGDNWVKREYTRHLAWSLNLPRRMHAAMYFY